MRCGRLVIIFCQTVQNFYVIHGTKLNDLELLAVVGIGDNVLCRELCLIQIVGVSAVVLVHKEVSDVFA